MDGPSVGDIEKAVGDISANGWLVVSNIFVIFHNKKGMSSFPLTNSHIFSRWLQHVKTTNQMEMLQRVACSNDHGVS